MIHARPRQYLAATQRVVAHADALEWEELPSFASSLSQRLVHRGSGPAHASQPRGANDSSFIAPIASPWDNTMPAPFDPAPAPQPFREALPGLAAREVFEEGVFQHFFRPSR